MKNNTSFALMDGILSKWLFEKLLKEPPASPHAQDLLLAVADFMTGDIDRLLLCSTQGKALVETMVETALSIGALFIDPKSRRVQMEGKEVTLTPKEFDVLYFLARNQGEVFTKEQIYQAVWAEDFLLADSNIMAFIRKIRKKIEPNPDAPEYLLTIWGVGYKFRDG